MSRPFDTAEASPSSDAAAAPAPIAARDADFLRFLRRFSFVEGASTLGLFGDAMPLKYAAGMPQAVAVVGALHGVLFVGLILLFAIGVRRIPLPLRTALLGVLCAVVPFGPFFMDRRLAKLA